MKTVLDFLKTVDAVGCYAAYWESDGTDPLWCGYISDTPWWIAISELDYESAKADGEKPISYRNNFGNEYNDRAGFVFWIKTEEV